MPNLQTNGGALETFIFYHALESRAHYWPERVIMAVRDLPSINDNYCSSGCQ